MLEPNNKLLLINYKLTMIIFWTLFNNFMIIFLFNLLQSLILKLSFYSSLKSATFSINSINLKNQKSMLSYFCFFSIQILAHLKLSLNCFFVYLFREVLSIWIILQWYQVSPLITILTTFPMAIDGLLMLQKQ